MKAIVIDTNPNKLDSICRGLMLFGHDCIAHADANAALEMLNTAEGDAVDVLITSLNNKNHSTIDLYRRVLKTKPNLKLIAITGLNEARQVERIREKGGVILQIPFDADDLNQALTTVAGATEHTRETDKTNPPKKQRMETQCL